MNKKFKSIVFLIMTAIIWGSAFVFQRKSASFTDAFTFNTFRSLVACSAFVIVYYSMKLLKKEITVENELSNKQYLLYGLFCGLIIFGAASFQQLGLKFSTAAKAGFLTSTQVVIVPILALFLHKKPSIHIVFCTILALVGFYVMSVKGDFLPSIGDTLLLICAVFFSINILIIDKVSSRINPLKFGFLFTFVVLILSFISMMLFEKPTLSGIKASSISFVYVGVMSGVFATITQVYGQKNASPAVATLILSLQSVFALVFGFIFLKEIISFREAIGCVIVFASVVISQINFRKGKRENEEN